MSGDMIRFAVVAAVAAGALVAWIITSDPFWNGVAFGSAVVLAYRLGQLA